MELTHNKGGVIHWHKDAGPIHFGGESAPDSFEGGGQGAERRFQRHGRARRVEPVPLNHLRVGGKSQISLMLWYLYIYSGAGAPGKDPADAKNQCGGNNWQTYDTMFSRQVVDNPTTN